MEWADSGCSDQMQGEYRLWKEEGESGLPAVLYELRMGHFRGTNISLSERLEKLT